MNVFIILNVYTPYDCYKNEDEYMNRLAFLNYYIKECTYANIFVMGDLNAFLMINLALVSTCYSFVRIVNWSFPV